MRTIALLILAAFALGAAAQATAYPVELTVTSSQAWMVADGKDSVTITATVLRGTGELAGQPLEGANVSFATGSPWKLKNTFLLTDKNGNATTILQDTTKSGTATVTITAWAMIDTETWGFMNYSVTQNITQPIDHTTPSSIRASYLNQGQVGTPTRISVLVTDKYGNPVDNRNAVENVRFDAASAGSGFQSDSSWVKSITVPLNASGYAEVQYFIYPVGANYVSITPPAPLKTGLISITGVSQGNPFSVVAAVSPGGSPYPYTVVNTGEFTLAFTFYDQFGFPTANQPVNITTNVPSEFMSPRTNKDGMVIIKYGPKDVAGLYNITGKAANNASVSVTETVEFVSGDPTDALLTASPQTMASRDVKEDITSVLTMKVIDKKGNPVDGEKVSFRFVSFSNITPYNQTQPPALEQGSASTTSLNSDIQAVTDEDGDAVVTFHPGKFTTDINDPKYNATATGNAVVEAQWSSIKRQVTLRYLNSRYLTITSEVDPSTVRVNGTVEVTVKVIGDGWALQPKPIDVILINDRSGSMLSDYPDRAVSVMNASRVFSNQLDYTRDYLGLMSFGGKGQQSVNTKTCGWDNTTKDDASYASAFYKGSGNYSDYATFDLNMTNLNTTITTKINTLYPGGWTPMRYALKLAIDNLNSKGRQNAVKALVILSDGDYNYYGDPLARGSVGPGDGANSVYEDTIRDYVSFTGVPDQNMARYANLSRIRIFTIRYASEVSPEGILALNLLASQTGGKNYSALSEAELAKVYTDIAGSLRDEAGVNTTLNLAFHNISVTNENVTSTMTGDQVYAYQFIPGRSTLIDTWNLTKDGTQNHFNPNYPMTTNDTAQWGSNQTFRFNIGTIRLGQTWLSRVTLKVLKEGTIKVFDNSSRVYTQDAANPNSSMPLTIPDVFLMAIPNNSVSNLQGLAELSISNLKLTNPGSNTSMDLAWNLGYTGNHTIAEDISISPGGTYYWNHLPPQYVNYSLRQNDTARMGITSDLPFGNYSVRVQVSAEDADPDEAWLCIQNTGTGVRENPGVCDDLDTWPYGTGWPPGIILPGITPVPTMKTYIKFS